MPVSCSSGIDLNINLEEITRFLIVERHYATMTMRYPLQLAQSQEDWPTIMYPPILMFAGVAGDRHHHCGCWHTFKFFMESASSGGWSDRRPSTSEHGDVNRGFVDVLKNHVDVPCNDTRQGYPEAGLV